MKPVQPPKAKAQPAPPVPTKFEHSLRLVSLFDQRQVVGIAQIRQILAQRGFQCDHFEYKIVIKTEVKRPINPKNPQGPTERVLMEEKVNVNGTLKGLRQLAWRATQEPENLLHVQLERIKGESCSAPILFKKILAQNIPILVTGASQFMHKQLLAKPDLNFEKIPDIIAQDAALLEDLIARGNRKKGMQATARELMDMPGIKMHIAQKISQLATGRPITLSNAEAINIILLSDLNSRYLALLQGFQKEVEEKKTPPAVLCKLFADIMESVKPSLVANRLGDFLDPSREYKTNEQIFGQVYVILQKLDSNQKVEGDPNIVNKQVLYNRIKGMFVLSRAMVDPDLWEKCLFFHHPEDEKTDMKLNVGTLLTLIEKVQSRLQHVQATSSRGLQDTYMIYNLHRFLRRRPVFLSEKLNPIDRGLLRSGVCSKLGILASSQPLPGRSLTLFDEEKNPLSLRYHSLQTLSATLGFWFNTSLSQHYKSFLEPGRDSLLERFGQDFFEIMYLKMVKQPGLGISRAKLAAWVEGQKNLARLNERGYIQGDLDTDTEPLLTPEILLGSAKPLFAKEYSLEQFSKDVEEQRKAAHGFFAKLVALAKADKEEFSAYRFFGELIEEGNLNFHSEPFRRRARMTFLYEELSEIVTNACSNLLPDIERQAINRKFVLHIPESLAHMLFIGNEFVLSSTKTKIKVHILSRPQSKAEGLPTLSEGFVTNLERYLKAAQSKERKALLQAFDILIEYPKACQPYLQLLSLLTIDQLVRANLVVEEKSSRTTPAHIKFFHPDKNKLIVGALKQANLAKLYNFQGVNLKSNKQYEPDNYSLGQFLQGVVYFDSAKRSLKEIQETLNRIQDLLKRFAKSLHEKEEYKNYQKLVQQIQKLLGHPLEEFSDHNLSLTQKFAMKVKQLADASILPDGIIAQLHQEWKRKYPQESRKVFFFQQLLGEGAGSKDNLLLELKQAKDLMQMLRQKTILLYYPDKGKVGQTEQLETLCNFARMIQPQIEFYAETTGLNDAQLEILSRFFDPRNFFQDATLEAIVNPVFQQKSS